MQRAGIFCIAVLEAEQTVVGGRLEVHRAHDVNEPDVLGRLSQQKTTVMAFLGIENAHFREPAHDFRKEWRRDVNGVREVPGANSLLQVLPRHVAHRAQRILSGAV